MAVDGCIYVEWCHQVKKATGYNLCLHPWLISAARSEDHLILLCDFQMCQIISFVGCCRKFNSSIAHFCYLIKDRSNVGA